MGVAVVMMGVIVGMGMRHIRTLYYNITEVHACPGVASQPPIPPLDGVMTANRDSISF